MGNTNSQAMLQWEGNPVPRSKYVRDVENVNQATTEDCTNNENHENAAGKNSHFVNKVKLAEEYSCATISTIREALGHYEDLMDCKAKLTFEEFDVVFGLFLGDAEPHFELFASDEKEGIVSISGNSACEDEEDGSYLDVDPFEVICTSAVMCRGPIIDKLKIMFRAFNQRTKDDCEITPMGLVHVMKNATSGCHKLLDMEVPKLEEFQQVVDDLSDWIDSKQHESIECSNSNVERSGQAKQQLVFELEEMIVWMNDTNYFGIFLDRVQEQITEWVPNTLDLSKLFLTGKLFQDSDSSSSSDSSGSSVSGLSQKWNSQDENDSDTGAANDAAGNKPRVKLKYKPIKHPYVTQTIRSMSKATWWEPIPVVEASDSIEYMLTKWPKHQEWFVRFGTVDETKLDIDTNQLQVESDTNEWYAINWYLLLKSWISSLPELRKRSSSRSSKTSRGILEQVTKVTNSNTLKKTAKHSNYTSGSSRMNRSPSTLSIASKGSAATSGNIRRRRIKKPVTGSSQLSSVKAFKLCSLLVSRVDSVFFRPTYSINESSIALHKRKQRQILPIIVDQSLLSVIKILSDPSIISCHVYQSPYAYLANATLPEEALEFCNARSPPLATLSRLDVLEAFVEDLHALGVAASVTLEWLQFPLFRVSCVHESDTMFSALEMMANQQLSSIPVLGPDGQLISSFSSATAQRCLTELLGEDGVVGEDNQLRKTIGEGNRVAVEPIDNNFVGASISSILSERDSKVCSCTLPARLSDVMLAMLEARSERCYIVNDSFQVISVIVASDVLRIVYYTIARKYKGHKKDIPQNLLKMPK